MCLCGDLKLSPPIFGVNILHADHQALAAQFAGRDGLRGVERYCGADWSHLLDDGAAILDDSLAGLDCVVEEILQRRGHAIGIGRVRAILIRADGLPCFIAGAPTGKSFGENQPIESKEEFYEPNCFGTQTGRIF